MPGLEFAVLTAMTTGSHLSSICMRFSTRWISGQWIIANPSVWNILL